LKWLWIFAKSGEPSPIETLGDKLPLEKKGEAKIKIKV
jgi:hypothetical protein